MDLLISGVNANPRILISVFFLRFMISIFPCIMALNAASSIAKPATDGLRGMARIQFGTCNQVGSFTSEVPECCLHGYGTNGSGVALRVNVKISVITGSSEPATCPPSPSKHVRRKLMWLYM